MLKKQLNAQVHYLTKSRYVSLLKNNPYIDSVYQIENSISEIIADLKKEKYDYVIDLHNNLRTQILKFRLGVSAKRFNKLNMEKFLLTTFKLDIMSEVHIVDRYLETVNHLGIKNDNQGLDFFLSATDKIDISIFPKDYIVFVIGGQHATKILPNEKIISIIKKVNKPVLLVGGPEDFEKGEQIIANTNNTINTCGKYSILQSASLVQQAKMVITHDTGMMHIAAAFQQKIYSVWGNTVPEFGMYPYMQSEQSKRIEVKDLNCRPCSKIGYDKCPKGHFKCMQEIDENLFLSE
ncbi:MAG: glycosyltransferase family 9 protein [Flavobacteriales bacterium]|nr:glycosyltransferase family 9 protein [Flavobacteriales bacterium]MBT5089629.1 glycosyltransferase family 9 protein [Flavobacteriales bacterium]